MSLRKMYDGADDFDKSLTEGVVLLMGRLGETPPDPADAQDMKHLLSVFITATIRMDPQSLEDPDMDKKLTSVRRALLAAYNLGRERGPVEEE